VLPWPQVLGYSHGLMSHRHFPCARPLSPLALPVLVLALSACAHAPRPVVQPYPALPLPSAVVVVSDEASARGPAVLPHTRLLAALGVPVRTATVARLEDEGLAGEGSVVLLTAPAAVTLGPEAQALLLAACTRGTVLVVEGLAPVAAAAGVTAGPELEVRYARARGYEENPIEWSPVAQVTTLTSPAGAELLEVAAPGGQPLAVSVARGKGRVIVLATALDVDGGRGYGRYPFLPQTLLEAGLRLPVRSPRLDALFDHGYREEADLEALAQRWDGLGIRSVHVGAWDFWEEDAELDAYLRRLITAAHRRGILVYSWLELPHVSPKFWADHPAWREKTGTNADAALDWRLLMNLRNPDCARAVHAGLEDLIARFDWDGITVSELYFESPSGALSPPTMTPYNADVRREYRARSGLDPLDFLDQRSPHFWKTDPTAWKQFVDWRVDLERQLNEEYLVHLEEIRRRSRPDLGVALLFVDNLYDTRMRENIGADVTVILPLLDKYDFTLIIEDPGTLWQLGPERYSELASAYARLTPHMDRLAVDINIVDRGQPVFPTVRQTGGELAQLLHHAGRSFDGVMIYAEQTLLDHDAELVSPALSAGSSLVATASGLEVTTRVPLVYHAPAPLGRVLLDGREWPAVDGADVWLPTGDHVLSVAPAGPARPRLRRLTGLLRDARYAADGALELDYQAEARAFALLDRVPAAVSVDGAPQAGPFAAQLVLPRGSHRVRVTFAASAETGR
jgi:hypothetical protein